MSVDTSIEWTDATWSPLRARRRDTGKVGQHCERVSPGCAHCYAARHNGRNLPTGGTGLDYVRASRDLVETFVDERVLAQPLRWREPKRIFVCNQTDLFADFYTDEQRDRVFAVMDLARWHTFQVLTKRPERMREYVHALKWERLRKWMNLAADGGGHRPGAYNLTTIAERREKHAFLWGDKEALRHRRPTIPLRNVWLGVTAEDQQRADERIPILLDTPAAVRFVSAEPLLGAVELNPFVLHEHPCDRFYTLAREHNVGRCTCRGTLDWVIVGGESGPGARPCNVAWLRSSVEQCRAASVPVFVKQLGAYAILDPRFDRSVAGWTRRLSDPKGGDPFEWPEDLRVREFPQAERTVPS